MRSSPTRDHRIGRRSRKFLIVAFLAFGLAWILLQLTALELWWAYPKFQASVFLVAYGTGVLFSIGTCGASLRLVIGGASVSSLWRAASVAAFAFAAWVLNDLNKAAFADIAESYWEVASGQIAPATVWYDAETGRVVVRGVLQRGSATRFRDVLESAPLARVVELESPGGLVWEAEWISKQIEARRMDTLIVRSCASACVDIFASGQERLMHARATVGLHSVSSTADDQAWVEAENRAFAARLHRLGVEPRFLTIANQTPANQIWTNTARQAYVAGLATRVID